MPVSPDPASRALDLAGTLASAGIEPLDRLLLAHQLRQAADELLTHDAAGANQAGYSWQEIGNALGISRQAAYQRFGGPRPTSTPRPNQALPQLEAAMRGIFALLGAGRFETACADFTPRMLEHVPVAAVEKLWLECIDSLGAFVSLGPVTVRANGSMRVATATAIFADGELSAKVAFDKSRKITGMILAQPGFDSDL